MESRQRVMRLFTLTDTRSRGYFYASMEDTEKQLAPVGFLRVQRSYLVNMAHIQKLNYDRVILTDGTELPVSQKMHRTEESRPKKQWQRQALLQDVQSLPVPPTQIFGLDARIHFLADRQFRSVRQNHPVII